MTKPDPNTYWVIPGKLLAGEYPGHLSFVQARTRLRLFLSAGIRHFVDLTEEGELEDYRLALATEAASLGVTVSYQRIPIPDCSVPRQPQVMHQILEAIASGLAQQGITYVHCWGGIGRTGLAVACWLQEQGRTPEEALAELARLWQTTAKSRYRSSSPETAAQVAWIRNWRARKLGKTSV